MNSVAEGLSRPENAARETETRKPWTASHFVKRSRGLDSDGCANLMLVEDFPSLGVQNVPWGFGPAVKIEQSVERPSDAVDRAIADPAEVPVIFDETQSRREI